MRKILSVGGGLSVNITSGCIRECCFLWTCFKRIYSVFEIFQISMKYIETLCDANRCVEKDLLWFIIEFFLLRLSIIIREVFTYVYPISHPSSPALGFICKSIYCLMLIFKLNAARVLAINVSSLLKVCYHNMTENVTIFLARSSLIYSMSLTSQNLSTSCHGGVRTWKAITFLQRFFFRCQFIIYTLFFIFILFFIHSFVIH